jgi:hypothetical protein
MHITSTQLKNAELVAVAHDDRLSGQRVEWWLFREDEYVVIMSAMIEHSGGQDQWVADTISQAIAAAEEILESS